MAHYHSHHHTIEPQNMNNAFVAGIVLNFVFVIVEVVTGFYNHSLSLLSDAGHNLADVGALGLSLFAFKMLKVKSNDQYTYGYKKTSISRMGNEHNRKCFNRAFGTIFKHY